MSDLYLARSKKEAFTLVEVLIALAVGAVGIAAVLQLSGYAVKTAATNQNTASAAIHVKQRMEQLRGCTWKQVTNENYLAQTFMITRPAVDAVLQPTSETISLTPYPDASVANPIEVTMTGSTTRVISSNTNLKLQPKVRVDIRVKWSNPEKTLETSTIMARNGVTRTTLPITSQPVASTPTPSPSPTSTPGITPTPSPTPSPSVTPTPAATPTPTPSSPGNSGGRGNVGGKPGKG